MIETFKKYEAEYKFFDFYEDKSNIKNQYDFLKNIQEFYYLLETLEFLTDQKKLNLEINVLYFNKDYDVKLECNEVENKIIISISDQFSKNLINDKSLFGCLRKKYLFNAHSYKFKLKMIYLLIKTLRCFVFDNVNNTIKNFKVEYIESFLEEYDKFNKI